MKDDQKPLTAVVLHRKETTALDTMKPFEPVPMRLQEPRATASIMDVVQAKLAASVEADTTKMLKEREKQAASIRSITTDLTEALKIRAEGAVYMEQQLAEWLTAFQVGQRQRDQIQINEILFPKQLELQAKQLDAHLIDADATIDAALVRKGTARENELHRGRLQRAIDSDRMERVNEREQADHKLYLESLSAKSRLLAPPPDMTGSSAGIVGRGDVQEARNVAEDVADGSIPIDSRHLYHGLAALLWLNCVKRGMARDEAIQYVAERILDRQQRHPLDERDARMYHEKYLVELEQYRADLNTEKTAREQERDRETRATAENLRVHADVRKAAMERDAALARERTAKTFTGGAFDPKDDDDAN